MTGHRRGPKIEEGRDGRGSRLAPPVPGCECTVQSNPATGHCTGPCTNHCTTTRITVFGARGGSGTSTIAAALALCGRSMVTTELVTTEPATMSALLGTTTPADHPADILPKLTLTTEPSGAAELTVVDGGTLTNPASAPRGAHELRVGVLRGPCYLGLCALLAAGERLDGIVVVAEAGRALSVRDVADVNGIDVIAVVPASAGVARAIDAGLFAIRHDRLREFRRLQRLLTGILEPFPPPAESTVSPDELTAPESVDMSGTDLLGALCAPSCNNERRHPQQPQQPQRVERANMSAGGRDQRRPVESYTGSAICRHAETCR